MTDQAVLAKASGPDLTDKPRRRFRYRYKELHLHAGLLTILFVVAVFPATFAPHDPYELVGRAFIEPGSEFWFGTDEVGRDLFSRIIHGMQISLLSGTLAIGVGLFLGTFVGVISGLRPNGILDRAFTATSEAVMAIPGVLLALAIITTYGRGALIAAIAVGIGEAPGFARLIRGCVIRTGTLTYVEAARTCGARPFRVIFRHVIPSVLPPVLSYTALNFGGALLAIGSLSYLGFGEPPPSAEWGVLISSGQRYMVHAWWVAIIPGVVLTVVVILLNRIAYLLHGDDRR